MSILTFPPLRFLLHFTSPLPLNASHGTLRIPERAFRDDNRVSVYPSVYLSGAERVDVLRFAVLFDECLACHSMFGVAMVLGKILD